MAYAAVISLRQTIERLVTSPNTSIVSSSLGIITSALMEVESLKKVLEKLHRSIESATLNALDGQIREAVYELEDAIVSHVSDQLLSHSEVFSLDLQEVKHDVDSFTQNVKKMKKDYIKELRSQFPGKDCDSSLKIDFSGKKSKMVGASDVVGVIKGALTDGLVIRREAMSLVGMAGIGKTTVMKEVFEDSLIMDHFECRAGVTVGQKYQLKEIMQRILAQVNPGDSEMLLVEGEKELSESLYRSLVGRRYLVILDDIWEIKVWDYLNKCLPDNMNGSRVLMTTRHLVVAHYLADEGRVCHMRCLEKEESWDLLREKVFGEESCPFHLVEAGKKIAEKCDGLPLTILAVAGILSEADKTLEYWNEIAIQKQHSIFMDAYDRMSEVLLLSYNYLAQYLKACFLYMGVYPIKCEVTGPKLAKLWSAEGLIVTNSSQTVEDFAMRCLMDLIYRNLVMGQQSSTGIVKVCKLHSAYWYLCSREAEKKNFFHVLNSNTDDIKSVRRLSVQNGALLGMKDVYDSMSSNSSMHSLLCTGPYHQYQVPISFASRFLRVLDTLAIRFYQFPIEIVELMHLRYLAMTCHGELPPSISKLWNLQYLIVHRHLNIKFPNDSSYLPIEIWKMQELKHLEVTGSIIPDPCGAELPNLLTLLDVSVRSCTKKVLESIPNLKTLRIQIELAPDAAIAIPLSSFDHISCSVESFKFVIVNPELKFKVVTPLGSLQIFPSSLKKLSLGGFGYPWEDMKTIASLPNLEVLKLKSYAFRGPTWEIYPGQFLKLEYLLLEDTDLVHMMILDPRFHIERLIIRHCYKLKDIFTPNGSLADMAHLIGCDPSVSEKIKLKFSKCNWYLEFPWIK